MMMQHADVCLALPGGVGTLEEISEAYSWARVGENNSPCIFLDVNEYYRPLRIFSIKWWNNTFCQRRIVSSFYFLTH